VTGKANIVTDAGPGRRDEIAAVVAERVRALRTARKWSLDELASRSGVSKGMVAQIDGGRTNPSIGTLVRIADAFGVTIAKLVEDTRPPTVRVVRAGEYPVLWHGPAGGRARLLGGLDEPEFVELWEWVLNPGEEQVSDDHAVGTREIAHVLAGALTVVVDGEEYRAEIGETVLYPGDVPHTYRNDGTEATRFAMVVTLPAGEFDRRTHHR
jgi:transcriptional regulator with XRE-family HTH domain